MRVLRFSDGRAERAGILQDDQVHDLSAYADLRGLANVLATGGSGHEVVRHWMTDSPRHAVDAVTVLAPVDDRTRTFCAALNYVDHAAESGRPIYEEPLLFLKVPSNLIGPTDPIQAPQVGRFLDYEGEVAVVMGHGGADIDEDRAFDHVLGLTVLNDVTARDLQRREIDGRTAMDWFSGKALDDSTPVGPHIVTLDEAPPIEDITFRTTVNGKVVQEGRAGDMIFSAARLVSYVSQRVALRPLDIIATGTPARLEGYRKRKLEPGDVVDVEVDGIGLLHNVVR